MTRSVIIRPEAEEELTDAFAWYEDKNPGLGLEFVRCLDACLESIRRKPRQCLVVHDLVRRALLRRFPFGVFYTLQEDTITVLAVFHGSRDPQRWRDRI